MTELGHNPIRRHMQYLSIFFQTFFLFLSAISFPASAQEPRDKLLATIEEVLNVLKHTKKDYNEVTRALEIETKCGGRRCFGKSQRDQIILSAYGLGEPYGFLILIQIDLSNCIGIADLNSMDDVHLEFNKTAMPVIPHCAPNWTCEGKIEMARFSGKAGQNSIEALTRNKCVEDITLR